MRPREGQYWPDPARGTPARRDVDEVLRRALHAVADAVEPADDGLTRILHRLSTPSAIRQAALLATECADLVRLITIWLEPAFTGAARLRLRPPAGFRRGFSAQAARALSRPAGPWLRPALAVATAVTIVVIAVVVVGPVRQIVTRTSLNTGPGASAPAPAGAHSASGGRGPSPTVNLTRTVPTRSGTTSARAGRTSHRPWHHPQPGDHVIGASRGQSQPEPGSGAHAEQDQPRASQTSSGQDENPAGAQQDVSRAHPTCG